MDLMDGRAAVASPVRPGAVVRMPRAQVDRSAVLEGPCFVGEGARVEAGARVGAHSVLGAGCVVEKGASIKRGVVWRGARIGEARRCAAASSRRALRWGARFGL